MNHIELNAERTSRRRQHVQPDMVRPRIRTKIWVEVDHRFAIGEGGLDLLSAS
jgi:hypothetical protein